MKLRWSTPAPEAGDLGSTSGVAAATTSAPIEDSWDHWGKLGLHKGKLSCKGRLVLPLDPDVVHKTVMVKEVVTRPVLETGPTVVESVEVEKEEERISYRFRFSDLIAIKDLIVEEVGTLQAWQHLPLRKNAGAEINPLPIHEDLLHVEGNTVGAAPVGGTGAEKIWCKLCLKQLPRSKMRMHVGGHILKDKVR